MDPFILIRCIIFMSSFPIFNLVVLLKFNKEKNFEKILYFYLILSSYIALGITNFIYGLLTFSISYGQLELSVFFIRVHHSLYYLGMSFFAYFLVRLLYENQPKINKYILIALIILYVLITISFFILPMDNTTLKFIIMDFRTIITFSGALASLVMGGIFFTYALIFKLKGDKPVSKSLITSRILMVTGAWMIGIIASSFYYFNFDISMYILLVGELIFLLGYIFHEPFKIMVENALRKSTGIEIIKNINNFKEIFGFELAEDTQIMLLHDDIQAKMEILTKFLNYFEISQSRCILITQKGKSFKYNKLNGQNLINSKLTIFEYSVDKGSLGEIGNSIIRIPIDLSILYETIKTAHLSLQNEKYYLIFDSITDLINWHGFKPVYLFIRKVNDLLRNSKISALFSIHTKAHEQIELNQLLNSFDGTLEKKDNKFELKPFK